MAGMVMGRCPIAMTSAAVFVVLTGLRMFMLRCSSSWILTPEGIALGLGGLLGIGAFFIGLFVQKPAVERLGSLAAQIAASGAPPTPAQAAELQALRARLGRIAKVMAWHLIGAAILMASHRLATTL